MTQPTPTRVTCPDCSGTRTTIVLRHRNGLGEMAEIDCSTCQGTGTVDPAVLVWREQARAVRAARRQQDRTLHEVAALGGLTVPEVSAMETGRADPAPLERVLGVSHA